MNDSNTKIGWLFSWRTIRCCLFVLVCLFTLFALYYAEENWRGQRDWNTYRWELERRGEQLDYRAFIPQPVPDEENFAATPLVRSWFVRENSGSTRFDTDSYEQSARKVSDPKDKERGRRKFVDLVAWKAAFTAIRSGETNRHETFFATNKLDLETRAKAAPAVLEGLKSSETNLAELRAASQRPYSRYPVIYDLENPWGILIPHLARIKGVVQRLQLKACAELAAGHSENALEDVKLMLYMADSLKEEPILICYLVRLDCLQIAIQPVWEGLAEHRWSDSQLQECQYRLQQYNFLADMKRPLDGERAAGVLTADLLYRKKYRVSDLFDLGPPDPTGGVAVDLVSRIAPHGWYYQEQLNYCRLYENQLRGAFDAIKKRVSPSEIASNAHELEREVSGGRLGKGLNAIIHHQVIASMLLPALSNVPLKAATAQTTTDQAALACALERFRLANGQFPERLDALASRFLSQLANDIITGEPLKYRRTDDGLFVLYSVGWNEKDDGGTPGKTLFDEKEGDWVWRYPAK
ncbi:MAG: hypothetical protein DME24_06145 [Verrucomicrobia bacterium]|nr:MAG: hypothetical protein DME24_06145 [Verrucomicrobiota bacterium]